jgi:prolipoprotein diacylglyceryltransferase
MAFSRRAGNREEEMMPVLILWAVPTIIVVGGVGYFLVHTVH